MTHQTSDRIDERNVQLTQMLKADTGFTPCPIHDGDELFPNGIFVFNITKMLEHFKNNPDDVDLVEVALSDFCAEFSCIDESHVESVDISRPAVLAEISPGNYNLIDGNHRMEKARRVGASKMWEGMIYEKVNRCPCYGLIYFSGSRLFTRSRERS